MKVGVGSYTWPWAVGREGYTPRHPLRAAGIFELSRNLGVEVVQLADKPYLHEMSREELLRLDSAAKRNNLEIEVGTRGIEPSHLMTYLDIANVFHSTLVRTVTHQIDESAEARIREVLPAFEEAGVSLAMENHDEYSSKDFAGFIERIGSGNVGVCLDTVNSFAAMETPEIVVRTLAPYTLNLHVKDFNIARVGSELGFMVTGAPAGRGRLDVQWIVDRIKQEGKNPNAIIELWTPFSESLEATIQNESRWAVQSVEYMRTIVM